MNTRNETVVRDFCTAFARKNLEELLNFFTADAVYHNIPLEPVHGRDAIRNTFETFVAPADKVEFEILHMASADDVVFNERIDRFVIAGKQVALPVAGVFVIRDGKIAAWRDYFDVNMFMSQMAPAEG